MIPIPIGAEFGCVLSGSVYKVVRCAHCKKRFAYQMARSAEGTGDSLFFLGMAAAQEQAITEAQRKLMHKLNSECDAVPCLHCGIYQEEMMPVLRKNHRGWMFTTALILAIPIIVLSLLTYLNITETNRNVKDATIYFAAAMLLVFLAGGFILFRQLLANLLEPDSGPLSVRLKIASTRAMTIESFNEMMGKKVTNWMPLPMSSSEAVIAGQPPQQSESTSYRLN